MMVSVAYVRSCKNSSNFVFGLKDDDDDDDNYEGKY